MIVRITTIPATAAIKKTQLGMSRRTGRGVRSLLVKAMISEVSTRPVPNRRSNSSSSGSGST
jgi:hypothetical protein